MTVSPAIGLTVCSGPAAVGRVVADLVEALVHQGRATVGLATGASPMPMYRELCRRAGGRRPWRDGIEAFCLDEYVGLDPADPTSYRATIQRLLTDELGLPRRRLHVPDGAAADLGAACARHEAAIAQAGGIDLQLLGIGHNGHIAFNEPGSASTSRTRVVNLTDETRAANACWFPPGRDVPARAVTMGVGTILEARTIVLVAIGRGKAYAVARTLSAERRPDWPASALHGHDDVHLVVDSEAMALCRE